MAHGGSFLYTGPGAGGVARAGCLTPHGRAGLCALTATGLQRVGCTQTRRVSLQPERRSGQSGDALGPVRCHHPAQDGRAAKVHAASCRETRPHFPHCYQVVWDLEHPASVSPFAKCGGGLHVLQVSSIPALYPAVPRSWQVFIISSTDHQVWQPLPPWGQAACGGRGWEVSQESISGAEGRAAEI